MAPKTISLIALLSVALSLSATVTLSLAQTQCQRFGTLSDALKYYDFPTVLFPNDVQSFSCSPVILPGFKDAISLVVRLKGGACTVTREALGVTNVLRLEQEFSAIISYRQISNLKGVTVRLIAPSPPFGPLDLGITVDQVKVVQPTIITKFIQFYDSAGIVSPPFPVAILPSNPPTCDGKASAIFAAFDNLYDNAMVKDTHGIPNYGRILPVVA